MFYFGIFLYFCSYIITLCRNIQFIIPPLSVSLLKTTLWCQPLCINIGLHSLLFPWEGLLKENCRLKATNTFKTLDIFSSALFFTDLKARAQAFRESDKLGKFFKNSSMLLGMCRNVHECVYLRKWHQYTHTPSYLRGIVDHFLFSPYNGLYLLIFV